MSRKLFCKINQERGESVTVRGAAYVIGADGYVTVDDAHAEVLLQNTGKWADAAVAPAPFKRPTGAPQLILADAMGRVLSPEDTEKATDAARAAALKADAERAAAETPAPPPGAGDAEEPMPPEPAPPAWPEVSTDSSKKELLAVLEKLKVAGHVAADAFTDKMNKMDLLEVIQQAYDAMDAEPLAGP